MILISTLTTLVLATLQNVFLFSKAINHLVDTYQHSYALESVAYSLMQRAFQSSCVSTLRDPNKVIDLVEGKGCFFQKKYKYLYSTLGEYPCHQIIKDGKLYGSEHFLLTVINRQGDLVQIRFAKPHFNLLCENAKTVMIKKGILTFRILTKQQR